MILHRIDRAGIRLGATPIEVTPENFKIYRGVAAFGDVVLDYPEHGRSELAPAEDVMGPEALATLVGKPFTLHHPDDLLDARNPDDVRQHTEGNVLRAVPNLEANPPELLVDVIVYTADAQEAIESGKVCELSPGYRCEEEPAPAGAVKNGQPYQVIQRRRKYNHLSGVIEARGVAPDGRRARLDEASAGASYARNDMDPKQDQQEATEADRKKDEVEASATPLEDKAAPAQDDDPADPALALRMFSPEDQEILKGLSPEGMAHLLEMSVQMVAEEAEHEVRENPEGALAGEAAAEEAEEDDGTVPQAPQALTSDVLDQKLATFKADIMALLGKKDAPAEVEVEDKKRSDAAVITAAREAARMDAEFVGSIRRYGYRVDSFTAAGDAALSTIKEHEPSLAALAERALKEGRRTDFLAAFETAERRRRDALILDQENAIGVIHEAEVHYSAAKFVMPESAVGGA